jgi:DNA-binding PucR family transcriptional regulator
VIRCEGGGTADDDYWLEAGLRRAAPTSAPSLIGRRSGVVVAVVAASVSAVDLHRHLVGVNGEARCSVGVGADAVGAGHIPRSYSEAMRALQVRLHSGSPNGGTDFADLGLYQIMQDRATGNDVDGFVRRWLGPLLDYDTDHNTQLVQTLAEFLDSGGSYDSAAATLTIHRSTLRYRLRRIREVGRLDLGDAETRLNAHVATRAWRLLTPS